MADRTTPQPSVVSKKPDTPRLRLWASCGVSSERTRGVATDAAQADQGESYRGPGGRIRGRVSRAGARESARPRAGLVLRRLSPRAGRGAFRDGERLGVRGDRGRGGRCAGAAG